MDNKTKSIIGYAGFSFTLGLAVAVLAIPPKDRLESNPVEREFLCEDDGRLTERHVGVASAEHYNGDDTWRIYYVDSPNPVYYRQPSGETCSLQEYTPPAKVDDAEKILAQKWGGGK